MNLDTLFKIFEKFSSRPLYFIFFGLSVCEFLQKESALKSPNIENILYLLSAMIMVVFLTGDMNGSYLSSMSHWNLMIRAISALRLEQQH